jgi:hypothetical protein
MKMSNKSSKKPTLAEIEAARRESQKGYDDFMALSDTEKTRVAEELGALGSAASRPLTPAERELWKQARKRMGRPKRGDGAKPVNVTIERQLLARTDAYAKKRGLTRSQIIADGLEVILRRKAS